MTNHQNLFWRRRKHVTRLINVKKKLSFARGLSQIMLELKQKGFLNFTSFWLLTFAELCVTIAKKNDKKKQINKSNNRVHTAFWKKIPTFVNFSVIFPDKILKKRPFFPDFFMISLYFSLTKTRSNFV